MIQRATFEPPPRSRRHAAEPGGLPWDTLALCVTGFALRAAPALLAPAAGARGGAAALDDAIAWSLARGAGFSLAGPGGPHATALRAPLTPWLLNLLYRITGHSPLATALFGCVLGALLAPLLAAFARRTFGSGVARIAGWLVALSPLLAIGSGLWPAQVTSGTALLLALLVSAEWLKAPRRGRAFGAGLVWGLAALADPVALAIPPVVLAWAWVPLGLTVTPGERYRQAALLIAGLAIAVLPWTARNAAVVGGFVPIVAAAPAAPGASAPVAAAGRRLLRFWNPAQDASAVDGEPGLVGRRLHGLPDPRPAWAMLIELAALAGMVVTLRSGKRLFLSLALFAIAIAGVWAALPFGPAPSRMAIEPLLALYAAAAIDAGLRTRRVRRSGLTLVPRG